MAGLLDDQQGGLLSFLKSPEGQGLLAGGFAALGGRSVLGGISRGGLAGLGAYGQAQDRQQQIAQQQKQNQMFDVQLKQAQQGQQDQADLSALAQGFYKPATMTPDQVNAAPGPAGPTNTRAALLGNTQPTFDSTGFINAYMAKDPIKAMQLRASMVKELPFNKIDPKDYTPDSVAKFAQSQSYGDLVPRSKKELAPSGQVWDPYATQAGAIMPDPNKPFSIGPDGKPVANTPYQQFEFGKAKAGKTDVNLAVNTEKSLLTTMGEGLGKQLDSSLAGAQSATNTINTAQQIRQLVSSGKVITGPGADYRVTFARLGDALGVGGKDNAEKLANTAQLVQNLARTELSEAQSNKGQGQFTDAERVLLKRAASGDVNMSNPELLTLSGAMEKSGRSRIQQHQNQVQRLQQMPGAAPLIPFYSVDMPSGGGAGPSDGGIDDLVNKHRSK